MEVCGIEEAIEVCKELIAENSNDLLNCWDSGEEAKQAIETVIRALEDYREDYNHRCQLAIDRKKQLDNSISKDKIREAIEKTIK